MMPACVAITAKSFNRENHLRVLWKRYLMNRALESYLERLIPIEAIKPLRQETEARAADTKEVAPNDKDS